MTAPIAPILALLAGRCCEGTALVEAAYARAARHHEGEFRHSGEPYIVHPIAVALKVAEILPEPRLVAAALLHDVPAPPARDTSWLRAEFGAEVADLVEEVFALRRGSASQVSADAQLIRICDRWDNMRTLKPIHAERRRVKSRETLEVFVPVARDLGLDNVADDLEAFAASWLRPGRGFAAVRAGAWLLPPVARARYVREWSAEVTELNAGRERFQAELLFGMPALAWALWGERLRALARTLLTAAVRTPVRPWTLLAPLMLWLTWESAQQGLAEAVAFVVAVPPSLAAGIRRVRVALGLERS